MGESSEHHSISTARWIHLIFLIRNKQMDFKVNHVLNISSTMIALMHTLEKRMENSSLHPQGHKISNDNYVSENGS